MCFLYVHSKNDVKLLIGAKLTHLSNFQTFKKLRKYWLFPNHLFCLVTLLCTDSNHSCQNMVGGKFKQTKNHVHLVLFQTKSCIEWTLVLQTVFELK